MRSLDFQTRQAFLKTLTENERLRLAYLWEFYARPNQTEPEGNWRTWLVLAGRGFGKTRTSAEWVRGLVENGKAGRIALVAPTAADARDVMVEGESGILNISPPWFRPEYEPSKRRLTWPNGAMAITYSADEPDRLRGPQHDYAACDEIATWKYPSAWDNLLFGLRLGTDPRAIVTTTPRPTKLIKGLVKDKTTIITRGSTYENRDNLARPFLEQIIAKFEGSRIGRQELHAEILEDTEGALWKQALIDEYKVEHAPDLIRVVVGVDPAVSNTGNSSETGIITVGLGRDGRGYVIDDFSLQGSPAEWAEAAVTGYKTHQADRIIGEVNNGGDMIEHTIRTVDKTVSFKQVRASKGKFTRAEPVAALYEKGRISHVGNFPKLEDQMVTWVPGEKSPDRMDALVWAITELMIDTTPLVTAPPIIDMTRSNPWTM